MVGDVIAGDFVKNGWAGIVLFGYVRDKAALAALPLGVKALGINPRRSNKRSEGQTNIPVEIGGHVCHPGDHIYADEDGVIILNENVRREITSSLPASHICAASVRHSLFGAAWLRAAGIACFSAADRVALVTGHPSNASALTRTGNHTCETQGTGIRNSTSKSRSDDGHPSIARSAA